MRRKNQR